MITPMPIIVNREPDRCPNCNKIEDIKKVCRNCGHEYKDLPLTSTDVFYAATLGATFFWVLCTLVFWFIDYKNRPLFEIIKSQVEFISSLRIW